MTIWLLDHLKHYQWWARIFISHPLSSISTRLPYSPRVLKLSNRSPSSRLLVHFQVGMGERDMGYHFMVNERPLMFDCIGTNILQIVEFQ